MLATVRVSFSMYLNKSMGIYYRIKKYVKFWKNRYTSLFSEAIMTLSSNQLNHNVLKEILKSVFFCLLENGY